MTGRSVVLSLATIAVVAAVAGRCSAPDPAPLPAKTQARVTRHVTQTVVDSAETRRLQRVQGHLLAQLQEQSVLAANAIGDADREHRRADSLAAVQNWHSAYDARTLEADSLRSAGARKDSALTIAAHERMVSDSVFRITAGHVARSDSLITELLPLAQRRDRCSVFFGAIKCPSRKTVAIGSAIAGATAVIIVAKGGIRIRLPIG